MSGRRRRSESLWDRKEEAVPQNETKEFDSSFHGGGSPKWSNLETNDELMHDDFSMKPSREPIQGNENMSMDNDRHRMKMVPAFDEWEGQNSSRIADNVQPYRGVDRGVGGPGNVSRDRDRSRSRSLSPHRSRGRDRVRDLDRSRGSTRSLARSRSRSRGRDQGRARSPSRGGANRIENDPTEKWSIRPEYSGGSRDRNTTDYPRSKGSDGFKKDSARNEEARDYHRSNRSGYDDLDNRRESNQSIKLPCRFFIMGNCNRNNCRFSHDPSISECDERLHDNVHGHNSGFSDFPNPNPNSDDKNKSYDDPSWNNLESGGFNEMSCDIDIGSNQESQPIRDSSQLYNSDGHNIVSGETNTHHYSYGERFNQDVHHNSSQLPSNLNESGSNLQLNGSAQGMFLHMDLQNQTEVQNKEGGNPLESFKNNNPQVMSETLANAKPVPQTSQNLNLTNALGLLYSLPNSASSGGPVDSMVVNQPMSVPESQMSLEPVENLKVNENEIVEKSKGEEQNMNPGKSETQEKVEESNLGNDEKAMRQFKVALVEFVKDILKPTWKEGKMSREVYKTIVKKVVEKVTSTIQGVQIPRTQEKIDQYLAFSKSKITKLVEAYVGRHLKA